MLENISGWMFDLSKPIYLLNPNNKFWEVTLSGVNLRFRVGKIRDSN